MICDIQKLTSNNVLDYLKWLEQDPTVWSDKCKGMGSLLPNQDIYVFIKDNEVLVVGLDPGSTYTQELADEEPFNDEHPLYFTEDSHRKSPVWQLAVICESMRLRGYQSPQVWGLLLTSSLIMNYDDMHDIWNTLKTTVCHQVKGLTELSFTVHPDEALVTQLQTSIWHVDFNESNIEEATSVLRKQMEGVYPPFEPQNYDFDDEEKTTDYDMNDAVTSLKSIFDRNTIESEKLTGRLIKEVSGVSLKIASEGKQPLYTSYPFVVTLTPADGKILPLDTFKCYIYTKDLYPVCDMQKSSEKHIYKDLQITLRCMEIWLPGDYILLIYNGVNAEERIDFTLDEDLRIVMGERKGCAAFSQESILIYLFQGDSTQWTQLASQPGVAQFRQYIVKRKQLDLYQDFRYSRNHCILTSAAQNNLLICKHNNDIDEHFINNLAFLSKMGNRKVQFIDCSYLYDPSKPNNPYESLNEMLDVCVSHHIICLDNIGFLLNAGGKTILKRVKDLMKGKENVLWLCGTSQEIKAVLNECPSFNSLFSSNSRLVQEAYSTFDLIQRFHFSLKSRFSDNIPLDVHDALARAIMKSSKNGSIDSWSIESIRRYVEDTVCSHYFEHTLTTVRNRDYCPLSIDDLCLEKLSNSHDSFDDALRDLNEMVGLADIKSEILTLAYTARLFVKRRQAGFRSSESLTLHSTFVGAPGTGKTTLARLLGRIYHSLGLLSKGDVISVDHSKLIGQYIGDTEHNTKAILSEAQGNILFIDEAYSLVSGADDYKDYGRRVIDCLMSVLCEPNPDMIVIMAGYPQEMERLLTSNSGLASRFPYNFHFADYSADELTQIALQLLKRDDYILTDDAAVALKDVIKKQVANHQKNFGNARWVNTLVKNGIIPAFAHRVFSTGSDDLQHIDAQDILKACKMLETHSETARKPIGFRA